MLLGEIIEKQLKNSAQILMLEQNKQTPASMEADIYNTPDLTALLLHISQLHKSGIISTVQSGILKDRALTGDKVVGIIDLA